MGVQYYMPADTQHNLSFTSIHKIRFGVGGHVLSKHFLLAEMYVTSRVLQLSQVTFFSLVYATSTATCVKTCLRLSAEHKLNWTLSNISAL